MKELIYTIAAIKPVSKTIAEFFIEIVDEHTLQVLEKKYPGHMTCDGRTFTLKVTIPLRDMPERDPEMWETLLRDKPEVVQAFILERLRGNI